MLQTITEHGGGWTAAGPVADYVFAPRALNVHGTDAQKRRLLVPLITGEQRACFAVTEPDAGLDTTRVRTRAVRRDDHYYVTGEKVWITGADIADRMMILVRTAPLEATPRPIDGLTLLYAPIDRAYVETHPIRKHGFESLASNVVRINELPVPVEDRIGEEGKGFACLLDNINPERIVLAAMAVGMGRFAVRRAAKYAKERIVFGRPIGQNQAIQHPLAQCWAELEAANLMTFKAAALYDSKVPCGAEANAAKFLAAEAGYKACKQAVLTHGGNGYAKEFHMERQLREILLLQLAPVGQPLILSYIAERVLGLPKSY
jgi:acyl-CoA dehydrogenase